VVPVASPTAVDGYGTVDVALLLGMVAAVGGTATHVSVVSGGTVVCASAVGVGTTTRVSAEGATVGKGT